MNATEIYEVYQAWYKKFVHPKNVPSMSVFGRQLSMKLEKKKVGGLTYYYGMDFTDEGEKFRPKSGG